MHYLLKNNPYEKEILYSIFLYALYIVLFVLFSRKNSPVLRDFFCLPHAYFFVWRSGGGWAFWLSPGNGLFMKNPGNKSTLTAPGKRKNTVFLQIRNNGCRLLLMS